MKPSYIFLKDHEPQLIHQVYTVIAKWLFVLVLTCAFIRVPLTSYGQISRTQIINNAVPYTSSYVWNASSCNLWNGTLCGGRNIYRAPWVVVGSNASMPYMWGGWSTIPQHNTAMANCKSAGDVCSPGNGGNCSGGGSGENQQCASGHDCSGLVSRAWALTTKQSTSTLPAISTSIPLSQVQPGDILNDVGSHTRLIETNYGNGNYRVIEASGTDWRTSYRTYSAINLSSYDPRCPNSNIVIGGCGTVATPSNDNCPGTLLTSSTTCNYTANQTVNNATQSGKPKGVCDAYTGTSALADVWYNFQAVGTSTTITVDPNGSALDAVIVAYSSCTNNTEIGCSDNPGGNGTLSTLTISTTPGNSYYIRVYDYGLQTTNGDFRICVTNSGTAQPDLIVQNSQITPSSVCQGLQVTASCTNKNQGTGNASSSVTALWLSFDQIYNGSPTDTYLGQISIPTLTAGQTSNTLSQQVSIPLGPYAGTWYIMFGADGGTTVSESNENNNQVFVPISFQSNPPPVPTLNSASNITNSSFQANWNSVNGAIAYYLDVATNSSFTNLVSGYNNLNVGNITYHNVSGLTCGTTYYYRLRAANNCAYSNNSSNVSAATSACCITPSIPIITPSGPISACPDATTVLEVQSPQTGVTYYWSNGGTGVVHTYTNFNGSVYCWGSNSCGTSNNSDNVVISVISTPTTVTVNGDGTFCNNTTLTASGGAGGTIYWQNTTSNGTNTTTQSTNRTVTSSGTYYFRAVNNCGVWGPQGSAVVTISTAGNFWNGTVSTAWENPANWSCGTVPDANTKVYINSGSINSPIITSMATCKSINVAPGTSVRVTTGYKLNVTGSL